MRGRYPRLDPEHGRAVVFGVKLGVRDAQRLTELIEQADVTKSEYLRALVLRVLEREEHEPPEKAA